MPPPADRKASLSAPGRGSPREMWISPSNATESASQPVAVRP